MTVRIVLKDITVIHSRGTPFERTALRDISLEIESGKFYLITGSNGSGKTTLLQVIALLIKPFKGHVIFDGKNPWENPKSFRRKLGFSFQFPEDQMFEFTVKDEIAYASKNFGLENVEIRVKKALEMVGLEPERFMNRPPFTLSGGEKRKVAIASIVAHEPEILLLDEPFVNLDWPSRRELLEFLEKWKDSGKGTVVASHYINMLKDMADVILKIENGMMR